MEENRNVDKFFKDRLEADNDQDWAIPSDDIWMNAKSRFDKKEKRKRGFVFWLFGSGVVIISLGILGSILYNQKSENEKLDQYANRTELVENNVFEDAIIKKGSTTNITNTTDTQETISDNLSKENESQKLNSNTLLRNSNNVGKNKVENNQTEHVVNENIVSNDPNLVDPSRVQNVNKFNYQEIINTKSVSKSTVLIKNSSNELNPLELDLDGDTDGKIHPKLELLPYRDSPLKLSNPESDDFDLIAGLSVVAMPLVLDRPKYELGLSHSKYLISALVNSEVIEDEEAELNNIKISINNINITSRKWISKKWSYSIGANFGNLNVNTDIDILDTLDTDLNNFINDKYSIARSNLKSEVPDVGLIDGVELAVGDIINVKGNINLSLRAVQVPILLDYHIYKGKMEYLFGAGLSLDLLEFAQEEIDILIYKDQLQINKPFVQERVSEFTVDYSIYTNLSMRYHIHRNWNLGLSTKVSILEPAFSYAELGLYYRWHK